MSGYVLIKLTNLIFRNQNFSNKVAFLYSFSPISIFYISIYTESIFSLLTFSAMFCFFKYRMNNSQLYYSFFILLLFSINIFRSNGIVLVLFLLWDALDVFIILFYQKSPSPPIGIALFNRLREFFDANKNHDNRDNFIIYYLTVLMLNEI